MAQHLVAIKNSSALLQEGRKSGTSNAYTRRCLFSRCMLFYLAFSEKVPKKARKPKDMKENENEGVKDITLPVYIKEPVMASALHVYANEGQENIH